MSKSMKITGRLGLVVLLIAALQIIALAQGRGRGGGPPAVEVRRAASVLTEVSALLQPGLQDAPTLVAARHRIDPMVVQTPASIGHVCSNRTRWKRTRYFETILGLQQVCIPPQTVCGAGIKLRWRQIRI